ncbi:MULTISPECIES: dihydropteroate synthase [Corynebacterium]|uniref:dihydropteroate synthase n=1 Tax=Corynebacterium TaxID=1716 RepID=UPI001CE41562|nr:MULTISPECIES: dihydropteroate synthase [Corynebacterium]
MSFPSTSHTSTPATQVMGILNVTDDSFSDGGRYVAVDSALAQARQMLAEGADIIDVGGESTRPGATRVDPQQEASRIRPVIEQLSANNTVTSIDTMRASTAAVAVEAGVHYLNDVSGGLADPDMLTVAAQSGLPIILMHWKADTFESAAGYEQHGDIVAHVREFLLRRVDAAVAAGVAPEKVIVDPGIGFAKSPQDNWRLLQATGQLASEFADQSLRMLIGASRKRFLTALRPAADGAPGDPSSADDATAAVSAIAAIQGAWAVRVHAVAPSRAAVDVAYAVATGSGPDVPEDWRARRG